MKLLLFVIAFLTLIAGCKKDGTPNIGRHDIYIAGYDDNKAAYWKNGVVNYLTSRYNTSAAGIAVESDNIYVTGYETQFRANYWKNGVLVNLATNNPGCNSWANAITTSGNDVYIAGVEESNIYRNNVAKYWKNGVATTLSDSNNYASASGIAVVNNDVYVAGSENKAGGQNAKYWKNGQGVPLPNGVTATATAITVVNNDVYVAGYTSVPNAGSTQMVAMYWKNGVPVILGDSMHRSLPFGIFVQGNDIYVIGWENSSKGNQTAKIWKNGIGTYLAEETHVSTAVGISIVDNDVYVLVNDEDLSAGKKTIKLFKNGVAFIIPGNGYSRGIGLYIK